MFSCLFSFTGGSGRLHLLGNVFFWLLAMTCSLLVYFIFIETPVYGLASFYTISALSFFSLWAVTVRRIHDLGQSGWWAIFFVLLLYVPPFSIVFYDQATGGLILKGMQKQGGLMMDDKTLIAVGVMMTSFLLSFIIFIVLACAPGKLDDNDYIVN